MCGGGGNAAGEIEKQNLQRQQAIQQGMVGIDQAFAGFGKEYFEGVRRNALAGLLPQFNRQYRQTAKGLGTSFADRGLLSSSAAREAGTDLAVQRNIGLNSVLGQANEQVRQTQQQIEGQRQTAVNQLIASQDPTLAAQQAVAGAAQIQAPSLVAPLGNLFQNFANTWYARNLGQTVNSPSTEFSLRSAGGGLPNNYKVK